tara:strand:- start:1763 stop:1867 length:105 start_codon:yes stop_codon:yes gene_type:complete
MPTITTKESIVLDADGNVMEPKKVAKKKSSKKEE